MKSSIINIILILLILMLSISVFTGCNNADKSDALSSEDLCYVASNMDWSDNIGGYGNNTVVSVRHPIAGINLSDLRIYDVSGEYKNVAKLVADPMKIQIVGDKIYYQSSIFNGIAGDLYVCGTNMIFPKKVISSDIKMYLVCGDKIVYTYSVLDNDAIKLAVLDRKNKRHRYLCDNTAQVFSVNEDNLIYYDIDRLAFVICSLNTLEILNEIPFKIVSDCKLFNIVSDGDSVFAFVGGGGLSGDLYKISVDGVETKLLFSGYIFRMWRIKGKVYCYGNYSLIAIDDNGNTEVIFESEELNGSLFYNGECFIYRKRNDDKECIASIDLSGRETVLYDIIIDE